MADWAPAPAPGAASVSSRGGSDAVTMLVPKREAVLVEYPGYVVDDARALASLGGAADVAEACSSTSTAPELRLKFRPNDPLSHPLLGTKTNANALVLCIKRKDSHGSGTANNAPGVFGAGLAITAVARVTREIKFQNMAEYQHTRAVESPELAGMCGVGGGGDGCARSDAHYTGHDSALSYDSTRNSAHQFAVPMPDGSHRDPFHVVARADAALVSQTVLSGNETRGLMSNTSGENPGESSELSPAGKANAKHETLSTVSKKRTAGDARTTKTVGSLICRLPKSGVDVPDDYLVVAASCPRNGDPSRTFESQRTAHALGKTKPGKAEEVSFADTDVPLWPGDEEVRGIVELVALGDGDESNATMDVKKQVIDLFAQRKVWPHDALLESLIASIAGDATGNTTGDDTKKIRINLELKVKQAAERLLPRVAFRFADGPFRRAWVLKGTDPRVDSKNAKLQVMEIRLDQEWFAEDGRLVVVGSKSGKKQHASVKVSASHADAHAFRALPASLSSGGKAASQKSQPAIASRYPRYQLCDITLASVQTVLVRNERRHDTTRQDTTHQLTSQLCRQSFGFFSKSEYEQVRGCLAAAAAAVFHGKDPEAASAEALRGLESAMDASDAMDADDDADNDDMDADHDDVAGGTEDLSEDGSDEETEREFRNKPPPATERAVRFALTHKSLDLETLVLQSANVTDAMNPVDGEMEYDVFDGDTDGEDSDE